MNIRESKESDLEAIVNLLVNDKLGQIREQTRNFDLYRKAFHQIQNQEGNQILVMCKGSEVVACLQITFIPNLTFEGGLRAQIEGVRVREDMRGLGFGRKLLEHAEKLARQKNCRMLQLTSNKVRPEAVEFYLSLGYEGSHVGFKKYL